MRKVLLIAQEYPPAKGAGVERTFALSRDLQDFGWQPIVLTMKPRAYDMFDTSRKIPHDLVPYVFRAFSFNAARDFSLAGKYPGILSIPDRWSSWFFDGYRTGYNLISQYQPQLIWSTFPVATSHLIALFLKKRSGLPWVCDFRDPMPFHYSKCLSLQKKAFQWIDARSVQQADASVFVTNHMKQLYAKSYPNFTKKFHIIENGYNEENYKNIKIEEKKPDGFFRMLHSGTISEERRNPRVVFDALKILKQESKISSDRFVFIFRGVNNPEYFEKLADMSDVSDLIQFLPDTDYANSLQEMFTVDALVAIQGEIYKNQIPGKIYEYIRAKKPILAISSTDSAVGQFIEQFEFGLVGNSPAAIAEHIEKIMNGSLRVECEVERFSRYSRAKEFAKLFDSLI